MATKKKKRSKHPGIKFLRLSDGRHVARFRDPVSRKQVQQSLDKLGLTTARQRELWAIDKLAELQELAKAVSLGGAMKVRVSIEQAKADYMASFANANTLASKRAPLREFTEWMQEKGIHSVQDIAGPLLAAWADHIRRPANPHKVSTRNWHLMCAAAWLRWCSLRGLLPRVSDDQIRQGLKRQKDTKDPIEVLAPSELKALMRALTAHDASERPRIAPFALFVLLSGMRYAEAEGLTWAEIDFDDQLIRLGSGRTKTSAAREITLAESPTAHELLRALRLRSGGTRGRVFPDIDRRRAETIRKRTQRDYDAPFWSWHLLRRTCGSLACSAGILGPATPFLVAARLGHSFQIAEKHYQTVYRNLPKDAKTIEQAADIEDLAHEIVRSMAVTAASAAAS